MHVETAKPFALFENQTPSQGQHPYEIYSTSIEEIKTSEGDEVVDCLQKLQTLSAQGYFLVGYLAYEAFEYATKTSKTPLLHFHAFAERHSFTREIFEETILPQLIKIDEVSASPLVVWEFQVNETFTSYKNKLAKIKEYQRQGDTYQVNFTMKARFHWRGEAFQFFLELKKYQQVAMAAFFHFDQDICSYSPELFIQKDQNLITARPMKGTAPRGATPDADDLIISQMRLDKKTLSENLMIVDLIRNDLGQIALPGTVSVPRLFEVETYSTLHQMTSTVQAQVDPALKFETLMQALFPCGSITGAPKKSTMKIIRELENEPRGLYTGAIGCIQPTGHFVFNVAIRTLLLTKNASGLNDGEMGLGSGIVYSSEVEREWEECLLKGKFVGLVNSPIQLIETFRYQRTIDSYQRKSECYLRLNLHLQRLKKSAEALGFACPLEKIRNDLLNNINVVDKITDVDHINSEHRLSTCETDRRVRLLLFQDGSFRWTHHPIEPTPEVYQVLCCQIPVEKNSILQQHKTTARSFYDRLYRKAVSLGFDEILFFNENDNCIEASRHNLIIKTDEGFLTPPLSDGALPGIFRQTLLEDLSFGLREQSFGWKQLSQAREVYLCNSVRGMVRAKISARRIS
jgi:para-aminobenzoate synthetase/4-amino-4-deoxychorismate lyase